MGSGWSGMDNMFTVLHNPLGWSKSLRLFPGGGGCGSGCEGWGVVFVTVGRRLYGGQGFK